MQQQIPVDGEKSASSFSLSGGIKKQRTNVRCFSSFRIRIQFPGRSDTS